MGLRGAEIMAKIEPENVPKCGTFRGTLLLNHLL